MFELLAGEASTAERNRQIEKKRNILVLMNQYLVENGYIETAERLQNEAGQIINKVIKISINLIPRNYIHFTSLRSLITSI